MKRGFTLLELLIGMTVFVIIATSVYTSLYLGLKVWKQEENLDATMREAMLSLGIIERGVRCAFLNPDNERIKFNGLVKRLDFFSSNLEGDIENLVFYAQVNEGTGLLSLLRSREKYMCLDDDVSPKEEIINTRLSKFKLKYFNKDENIWYESWPEELILPQQVKIEASFVSDDSSTSYDLVKYINIPMANNLDFPANE